MSRRKRGAAHESRASFPAFALAFSLRLLRIKRGRPRRESGSAVPPADLRGKPPRIAPRGSGSAPAHSEKGSRRDFSRPLPLPVIRLPDFFALCSVLLSRIIFSKTVFFSLFSRAAVSAALSSPRPSPGLLDNPPPSWLPLRPSAPVSCFPGSREGSESRPPLYIPLLYVYRESLSPCFPQYNF